MSGPYSAEQRLAHDNHHPYTVGCAICRDLEAEDAARAAAPPDWTVLANDIRLVDGNHDLGAGELAARLTERGWRRAAAPPVEPDGEWSAVAELDVNMATGERLYAQPFGRDADADGLPDYVPPPDRVAGLRERLLHALRTNAYRGSWHSDHQMMMPMAWDADDVVDRVIEDAALLDEPVPPSPVAGLREAADALVDEWDAAMRGDAPLDGHYQRQALERLRAALLAEPVPTCAGCAVYHDLHHPDHVPGGEPVPLDVERLARALEVLDDDPDILPSLHADEVAAEYARLTDPKGATDGE